MRILLYRFILRYENHRFETLHKIHEGANIQDVTTLRKIQLFHQHNSHTLATSKNPQAQSMMLPDKKLLLACPVHALNVCAQTTCCILPCYSQVRLSIVLS